MSYVYRRRDHNVDYLIEDNYWIRVEVTDTTADVGNYVLEIMGTQFVAEDTVAGVDDSAAMATSLIADINASALPVTARAGSGGVFYVEFEKGLIPVYQSVTDNAVSMETNYSAWTTDASGSITVREIHPDSYQVKAATNWDAVFGDIQKVLRHTGHVSTSLQNAQSRARNNSVSLQTRGRYVRFLFDPADYSLNDSHVNFLQIAPVLEGVELDVGPIEILLTTQQYTGMDPALILSGTVAAAADFDAATKFNLPVRTKSVVVTNNDTTNDAALAFGSGAGEITLASQGGSFRDNRVNTGYLSIRGDGGTAVVDIYVALGTTPTF